MHDAANENPLDTHVRKPKGILVHKGDELNGRYVAETSPLVAHFTK